MNEKKPSSLPVMGLGSLLVVFIALCLALVAMLALGAVKNDASRNDQTHNAIMNLYQAEREADVIIAQLRNGIIPDGVTCEDGVYQFRCVISDTRVLEVEVKLENGGHTVLRWEEVSTAEETSASAPE